MARDAIARQFDVDKNSVELTCEPGKGGYRPGTIAFFAKPGKSIDPGKIAESLRATRLSGSTNMEVTSLLITATGRVAAGEKELVLRVAGTDQRLALGEAPPGQGKAGEQTAFRRLRELVEKGEARVTVTGYVDGWSGKFPAVLRALQADAEAGKLPRLLLTEYKVVKE